MQNKRGERVAAIDVQKVMALFEEFAHDITDLRDKEHAQESYFAGFIAGYLGDTTDISPWSPRYYKYGFGRGYELSAMEDGRVLEDE